MFVRSKSSLANFTDSSLF